MKYDHQTIDKRAVIRVALYHKNTTTALRIEHKAPYIVGYLASDRYAIMHHLYFIRFDGLVAVILIDVKLQFSCVKYTYTARDIKKIVAFYFFLLVRLFIFLC